MVHVDTFTASSVATDCTRRITLAGELDMATAPNLQDELRRGATGPEEEVVLDLSALTFIDCAGTRTVLRFADRVRARGGRVTMLGPPPQLERVFGLLSAE
jgi:anti-sigma B factor antagonist